MQTFQEAVTQVEEAFNQFPLKKIENKENRVIYQVKIFEENVHLILLKTSLTGSDRAKPQIRVFTDKILTLANQAFAKNERFFCLVHCSHDAVSLKFNQITPSDYLVSLEGDWNNVAGRIDVRSVYDYLEEHPDKTYVKLNKTQHNAKSIQQAAIFKKTDVGLENFVSYVSFFDSRLVIKGDTEEIIEDLIEEDDLLETDENIKFVGHGLNKIYFGAPGTGKSFNIQQFIREHGIPHYEEKRGHPNVFRTTLHPEFTYYDFVGQVMPVVRKNMDEDDHANEGDTTLTYQFVPHVFTKALKYAIDHDKEPVFLILEEMSRANVAAVFGDLFQLLDRDVETGESEYRINNDLIATEIYNDDRKIYIPKNMYIIGTVNTNDQNVYVMDTAFKRRFEFEYVSANEIAFDDSNQPFNQFTFTLREQGETVEFHWLTLYRALNQFIVTKEERGGLGLKEDKQLGQFFLKFKKGDDDYNFKQIKGKLLQYLYEDIEIVSYTNISLFKREMNSFGEIYEKLSQRENVFSEGFLQVYNQFVKEDMTRGLYPNG